MTATCPRCGHVRSPADPEPDTLCPACGIVYAKYRAREEREAGSQAPRTPPRAREPMPLSAVCMVVAGTALAVLFIRSRYADFQPFYALLMVPFFFCFVPVVSYFASGGLYLWNKWTGRFDYHDVRERPITSVLWLVFFAAASAVFVVFLFKLPAA